MNYDVSSKLVNRSSFANGCYWQGIHQLIHDHGSMFLTLLNKLTLWAYDEGNRLIEISS